MRAYDAIQQGERNMLTKRSKTVLDLVGLIYDAVPDASRWQAFLESFVHATRSDRGTLALFGSTLPGCQIICWYGWKDQEIRVYMERYAAIDPWGAHDRLGEGEVCASEDLCPLDTFQNTVVFREFYGPCQILHGCGGIILRTDAGTSALTVARGKERGPCDESVLSLFRNLMPHLRRAALLHGDHASMRAQLATFTGHLDRYPQAFFLTGADARVIYANAAARETIAGPDCLAVRNGRLSLAAAYQRELQDAIATVTGGTGLPLRNVELPRGTGKSPYHLLVMNVPSLGALPLGTSQPAAAILVIDSESAIEPDLAILRELFALTPAEARVTGRLVLGRSVEEIASESGVSVETVRSQVRSILAKTNTGRQGELISLVLRMAPFRQI
jgi:DNA-binding CsgD family transcriptional regulator